MSPSLNLLHQIRRWATCTAALALLAAPAAFAAPNISSPAPEFDFGEKDNVGKVDHTFTVVNSGDEPLVITDVKSSCGCTVAQLKPEDKTVPPGGEVPVTASFNIAGRSGPQTKVITVMSNDPDQPSFPLTLKGTALAPILLDPQVLSLGEVQEGSDVTGSVTVSAGKPDISFEVVSANSVNPNFIAEVEPVTEGKEYKVNVKNTAVLPPGFQSGVIQLTTDNEQQQTLQFTITAQVVGPLDVNPKRIALLASEDPVRNYNIVLQITPGVVKEFNITGVEVPDASIRTEITPRNGGGYEIMLRDIPAIRELDGKEVVVKTDVPGKPEVRVPVKIIERPVAAPQPLPAAPAASN